MGLQSEKFINSFKSQIQAYLPNNKVVINANALSIQIPLSEDNLTLKDELRIAYENDCLSTLTAEQVKNDISNDIRNTYIAQADKAFENDLLANENVNNGNVDMYDFSMQLLDFDVSVAKTNGFGTNAISGYGFVSTGLSWAFHSGFNDLFHSSNSRAYELAKQYSIFTNTNDQILYDNSIKLKSTENNSIKENSNNYGTDIYDVSKSPLISMFSNKVSIVDNKVWFFNLQLRTLLTASKLDQNSQNPIFVQDAETIKYLNTNIGQVLNDTQSKSPTQYKVQLTNPLKPETLFQPNFIKAFNMAVIGAAIFISAFPIIAIDMIYIMFTFNVFEIKTKLKNRQLNLKN